MAVITCPECGAKNRVDERKAGTMQPVCGRCRSKLEAGGGNGSGHPLEITDASFAGVLQEAGPRPLLIDCWAPWCAPCRALAPAIEQVAAQANGRYLVGKLNVDENPQVASQFRVASIPTMLIFKSGHLVDQLVGVQPAEAIRLRLEAQG